MIRVRSRTIAAFVIGVAGIGLLLLPKAQGIEAPITATASVVVICIGLWATNVVPEYFTSIVFFFLAVTIAGAPPEVVFSGFSSTAVWLVFGGLVIAVAVQTTELGARIATGTVGYFGGSYYSLLLRTVITAALMGFFVPSNMGRILVMLPIFLSMGAKLGFERGSNGRVGITLAVAAGSIYPGFGILTASVPNVVLLGVSESIHDVRIGYAEYFLMHFPIISIVSILALPVLIRFLFPATTQPLQPQSSPAKWTQQQASLLLILVITLGLWITDAWHGISPAWVAMGAAICCLLPRLGPLPPTALTRNVNLGPWLFISGIIGMGSVVASSGLGDAIGGWLFARFGLMPGNDLFNFAAVSAIGMIISLATTVPGEPVIIATLADNISAATGWPIETVLLTRVINWSMAPFPYELPPMVVAAQIAGLRATDIMRLLIAMTLLAWIVMLPLQFLWLRYLGYFV